MALARRFNGGMRRSLRVVAAALALVGMLATAPRAAQASVEIGRANLDGTAVTPRLTGSDGSALDLAVDANHIYWTQAHPASGTIAASETIARANLDGTNVNQSFIAPTAAQGLAVDADHIYWTTGHGIGRADLDGTNLHNDFITGIGAFPGLAITADHIYWTNGASIGRANLDGGGIDPNFIDTMAQLSGVDVDDKYVYWTGERFGDGFEEVLGRATLDGTGAEDLIKRDQGFSHPSQWVDVAADASHLYLAQSDSYCGFESIFRAGLDGAAVDAFVPSLLPSPEGVAVDGGHIYWTHDAPSSCDDWIAASASAKKAQRQVGKRVILRVKVTAEEQLTATATGKIKINPTYKLKPNGIELGAGETQKLKLRPRNLAARRITAALKRGEKAIARLTVTLTDQVGNSETETLSVKLKG